MDDDDLDLHQDGPMKMMPSSLRHGDDDRIRHRSIGSIKMFYDEPLYVRYIHGAAEGRHGAGRFSFAMILVSLMACIARSGAVAVAAGTDTTVDCSIADGAALSKSLIGVYQTPFWFKTHPPDRNDLTSLLREAGVRHLRYELAWGKPDVFAFNMVGGTARHLTFDFRPFDPFLNQLERARVSPLLVLGYGPVPLQRKPASGQRWKDAPADLKAWAFVCERYAAHCEQAFHFPELSFEVWNEPDLPGDGGKVFFNDGPAGYGSVFRAAVSGVRAAGGTAAVGGPAYAYDTAYLTQSGLLDGPKETRPDFLSLHAYANAASQLAVLRAVNRARPLPIELTEYASFGTGDLRLLAGGHAAAAAFFTDVAYFLQQPDLRRVYWAQWIDDDLGLLSNDLHRRALFNAYSIYQTRLPVRQCKVAPATVGSIHVLAGADETSAGIVVWNGGDADAPATVHVSHAPACSNELHVYRIDAHHGSVKDDPATEKLTIGERVPVGSNHQVRWSGVVPARSVVFLQIGGKD